MDIRVFFHHLLYIVNNSAMNLGVQPPFSILLGVNLGMESWILW